MLQYFSETRVYVIYIYTYSAIKMSLAHSKYKVFVPKNFFWI